MQDAVGVVRGLLYGLAGGIVQTFVEGTYLLGVLKGVGQLINQFGLACLHGSADKGEQRLEIVHGQPGERLADGQLLGFFLAGHGGFSLAAWGLFDEGDYTLREEPNLLRGRPCRGGDEPGKAARWEPPP